MLYLRFLVNLWINQVGNEEMIGGIISNKIKPLNNPLC